MKGQQDVLAGLIFVILLGIIVFVIGAYWLIVIGLSILALLVGFVITKILERRRKK